MEYKITWQKPNGALLERIITHNPYYEIGYINSYDWIVVDIKRNRNNQWLSLAEYERQYNRSYALRRFTILLRNIIKDNQTIFIFILLYILIKVL